MDGHDIEEIFFFNFKYFTKIHGRRNRNEEKIKAVQPLQRQKI